MHKKIFTTSHIESALGYEILQEKAITLGLLAHRLEQAINALRKHDDIYTTNDNQKREELLYTAAHCAWNCMVQRELCGFRDWHKIIKFYGIPNEVINRMGAKKKSF